MRRCFNGYCCLNEYLHKKGVSFDLNTNASGRKLACQVKLASVELRLTLIASLNRLSGLFLQKQQPKSFLKSK